MRCYTISSLTRNRQQEVGKAAEHHCLLSSFHPSAGSRCIPAVFPRQLFPTSFPHLIIPPDMPVVAVKRKKAAIRPKIHVKGAITSSDPEEDSGVRKVKRDVDGGSGDDKRPRASTTRTYDSSDDDDGEDSDAMEQEEEDGTGKKVKSKKERQEERMASKGKQKEKAEERDARTVFVGNLPSACQPRVSAVSICQSFPVFFHERSFPKRAGAAKAFHPVWTHRICSTARDHSIGSKAAEKSCCH